MSFEDFLHVQKEIESWGQYGAECYGRVLLELYNSLCDSVKSRIARLEIQWEAQMSLLVLRYNNCVREIRQCAITGESYSPPSGAAEP